MTSVAIIGAAGKMGSRISRSLRGEAGYAALYVEGTDAGMKALADRGDAATPLPAALGGADIAVLAVPDRLIRSIAPGVVDGMKRGSLLVTLDPAAPHAGVIPARADIGVFVTHPCHPSVFNEETDLDKRFDFFGSGKARQSIVNALQRGPESDYARGEALAKVMWKPVLRSHRVTVEQMAILEPALSETLAATCITIIREGMDEAVRLGVPEAAARDFLLGHVFCELGIIFDQTEFPFSDGAKQAIREARGKLFREDWKSIFDAQEVLASVRRIAGL